MITPDLPSFYEDAVACASVKSTTTLAGTIEGMFGLNRNRVPKPFLHRIFPGGVQPHITEGWIYGTEETKIYGGYDEHHAVDFAVPTGTPVLAAADGWALASFEEVPIRYPGPQARTWQGQPVFWGFGLFVMILHKNGLVTYYAHLHRLADRVQAAYLAPQVLSPDDVVPPHTVFTKDDFCKNYPAVSVCTGDVIGYSGITGMGMGRRTYDNWLAGKPYAVNDEEHVHFALSPLPAVTADAPYVDPFGIHGLAEAYPAYSSNWALPRSLWLR